MPKSKKRRLIDSELSDAILMRQRGASIAQIAKHFEVNKPSVLKSLGLWDKVPPRNDWKVGERLEYKYKISDGSEFSAICKVKKVNGYNTKTGEMHLTLEDEKTGEVYNSAYEQHRIRLDSEKPEEKPIPHPSKAISPGTKIEVSTDNRG